ncbi:MAG: preprotein translocase subunit SecY [bacterium]|nr:preprotein translocase subunit SecY [bacterium]
MSTGGNLQTLAQSWNVPELKKRLLFVLQALVIFTIGVHLPTPGINADAVRQFFEQGAGSGDMFTLFNMFAGGALRKLSIFALGIMPYINASIMMQILVAVEPRLKQMQQEGEEGRKRISRWTRYLAVALAFLQGSGLLIAIYSGGGQKFIFGAEPSQLLPQITALLAVVGGTCFLMWLADEISQKGIGNGTSIIIMIGIVAGIPVQIYQELKQASMDQGRIFALLLLLILAVLVVGGIVLVQLAARKIPIQYARRQIGKKVYGGQSTYLPIKVTQAGVIPIIFAISILMVPATIFQWLPADSYSGLHAGWARFQSSGWYVLTEFLLVFLFTFVYTAVSFQTQDVADNLKKNNGFIPGIRPGKPTFEFLDKVLHRVTFFGGVFLGLLAILPALTNMIIVAFTGVKITSIYLGGTSLLITVGVALDTVQQMQAHMVMRHYSGFNR